MTAHPDAGSGAHHGAGSITDVAGVEVGHRTLAARPTGCSVVLVRAGAVCGVDVRGAAPGTRETDLLAPHNLVDRVHAVVLAGGSAWGLDAASGVMRWLGARGIGLAVGPARVPIVPAAVLFDLYLGDAAIRPGADDGFAACEAASNARPEEGNVGAGAGAAVGKIFGVGCAMKGGIGTASVTAGGFTVGALVACNALGDVVDPETGRPIAGARRAARVRDAGGLELLDSRRALLTGEKSARPLPGANTTIGVIATDARLSKAEAQRLATAGHDGLARAINPVHTPLDGDTLFALATGAVTRSSDPMLLSTMAAEAVMLATLRAVRAATAVTIGDLHLPCIADLGHAAPPTAA